MLNARVVEATNDIWPRQNGPTPVPFMYWQTHLPTLCAAQLINRFPDLVSFANAHYHGVPQMAHRWATQLRTKANNERAAQIRSIKTTWLSSNSKYALAYTYTRTVTTATETSDEESTEDFAVTESLSDSGINDVGQLRTLLRSKVMYRNKTVYALFCQGLESGDLKHSQRRGPTPITSLITIAHEAHFRAEMWYSLSKTDFKHNPKTTHILKRKENFNAFALLVKQDRIDNASEAHELRIASDEEHCAIPATLEPIDPSFY